MFTILKSSINIKNFQNYRLVKPKISLQKNGIRFLNSYSKTSIQKLSSDEEVHLQIISFSKFGFVLNQSIRVIGPMIIFPKSIFSWNISDINEVNEKSLLLFEVLVPKIDILIIGSGDKFKKIDEAVPRWLIKKKISFEILPTEKAVNVFNFLIAENRFVAGAFLPSSNIQQNDIKVKRLDEISSMYRKNT